ncbi:MAG: DUF456 domain-containing protein [Bacillaceae bacterium]
METLLLWGAIIVLFIASFVALIFPILPGLLFLWGGFILYYFALNDPALHVSFWFFATGITAFLFIVDFLANSYFIREKTDSKWSERIGCIAIILGSLIVPPFGLILVPFVMVFVAELVQKKPVSNAFMTAFATVIAFLSSVIAKFIIQLIMVILFLLYIILS